MTREEYHQIPALNFSMAKWLLRSPAHFKAAQDEEREETEAMRIGTLVHAMVLEGKDLRDIYAIKPEGMSFSTKEGKAWRDAQTLPILTQDAADGIPRIAEAIARNPDAAAALHGCPVRERGITFQMRGMACKALLDCSGTDGNSWAIGDLKTAADASPREFARQAYKMHLDMQAAWYSDGLAAVEGLETPPWFFWIVAEKKSPFFNVLYQPDARMMESGRAKMAKALSRYIRCMETGEWPLPLTGIQTLELPHYAVIEEREEEEFHREGRAA